MLHQRGHYVGLVGDTPKGQANLTKLLAEGEKDRARYLAIGESDRMTLKFVKPR